MALLFLIGYAVIIFEEYLGINKSRVGLLMVVGLWVIQSIWINDYLFCILTFEIIG